MRTQLRHKELEVRSLLTAQSDAEKRQQHKGNMAVLHVKAKQGITGRGGWFYRED